MKKLIQRSVAALLVLICISGCGSSTIKVNTDNTEQLNSNSLGEMQEIGGNLHYDLATRVVYRANYTYMGNHVFIPYIAPNGLPYRYDVENNKLVEIEKGNE